MREKKKLVADASLKTELVAGASLAARGVGLPISSATIDIAGESYSTPEACANYLGAARKKL